MQREETGSSRRGGWRALEAEGFAVARDAAAVSRRERGQSRRRRRRREYGTNTAKAVVLSTPLTAFLTSSTSALGPHVPTATPPPRMTFSLCRDERTSSMAELRIVGMWGRPARRET